MEQREITEMVAYQETVQRKLDGKRVQVYATGGRKVSPAESKEAWKVEWPVELSEGPSAE